MDIRRWHVRLLIISSIVLLPFAGYLVGSHYPLLRPETAAAAGLLLLSCAALALVSRGWLLYVATVACGCVVAAVPLQRALAPAARIPAWGAAAALAAVLGALCFRLRERYFRMVVVFCAGAFGAHCIANLAGAFPTRRTGTAGRGVRPAHVLHVILDGHIGLDSLPQDIPECRRAADAVRSTFSRHGFTLYSRAYSNYASTLDSVPSLLQRRLLPRSRAFAGEGVPDEHGIYRLDAGGFFREARRRYRIVQICDPRLVLQHDPGVHVVEYSGGLAELAGTSLPWHEKMRALVGNYQGSDDVLAAAKGFFPFFRFGRKSLEPLAVSQVWPARMAEEIESAAEPTLFFAHLLAPHGPFLFRRDGSVRPLAEWAHDQDYTPLDEAGYRERYTRYAEQMEYVQSQLDKLLARLDRRGLLEGMTVIVHGDHGSRIRLRRTGLLPPVAGGRHPVDRYDYSGEPELRDLMDRFSILLAVKLPGQREAALDSRPLSALRVLAESIYRSDVPSDCDRTFLFDDGNQPRGIALADLWNQ